MLAALTGNNTVFRAAAISLRTPVPSTLLNEDVDYLKFTAPSGPRDYMRLTLTNAAPGLAIHVEVLNPDKNPTGQATGEAAADVSYSFAAVPAATHYVVVKPRYGRGGVYSLVVEPTRSFDEFEENDTILTAKPIPTARAIEANILDTGDTDYYSFQARGATTVVSLENKSDTLAAGLWVTDADKAPVGSAQGETKANVRYTFESKPGATYRVQVSARYAQGGAYALTVQ